MFKFREGLYTDVRVEDVFETWIVYSLGKLEEFKERKYRGAFIRVYDGKKWYYSSTTDADIQKEIDDLSKYARPAADIASDPVVKKFKPVKREAMRYAGREVSAVPGADKLALLKSYVPALEGAKNVTLWRANYIDRRRVKSFYSSAGSSIVFDVQRAGFTINFTMADGDKKLPESFQKSAGDVEGIRSRHGEFAAHLERCRDFLANSKPVEPGKYTVVLAPEPAGIFAHESFGHKSEADFMIGDETMKREWKIGRKVGSESLTIIDSGVIGAAGPDAESQGDGEHVPFDDEGTESSVTYLIKNGILAGRLHSVETAAMLSEEPTGNGRAINFEFEPIVRMRNTYILPGKKTKEELIGEVKNGLYVHKLAHGSGMSTFTMAPSLAYAIRDGKIAEPVRVSVITGNVFETLNEIDGLSDTLEISAFVAGGCGKSGQWPLPVGFGGPYVRINNMNVQ